jgi:cytoskeleton protein RodZ
MKSPKEIGSYLKETREKKGLSLEKIHKATRIQSNILEAIEQGKGEEHLGRVYVLLFVKRYAAFLDLDGDGLVAEYKGFYADEEKKKKQQGGEDLRFTLEHQLRRWMVPVITLIGVIVISFLVLSLGLKMRALIGAKEPYAPATKKRSVETGAEKRKETKAEAVPAPKKTVAKPVTTKPTDTLFPIPRDKRIELVLTSSDEVWMRIEADGNAAFEGTLRKKTKKTISADDAIELWVGRAETLDFTINGTSIGSIGKGRIKKILISRDGLKIGNKWLMRADR